MTTRTPSGTGTRRPTAAGTARSGANRGGGGGRTTSASGGTSRGGAGARSAERGMIAPRGLSSRRGSRRQPANRSTVAVGADGLPTTGKFGFFVKGLASTIPAFRGRTAPQLARLASLYWQTASDEVRNDYIRCGFLEECEDVEGLRTGQEFKSVNFGAPNRGAAALRGLGFSQQYISSRGRGSRGRGSRSRSRCAGLDETKCEADRTCVPRRSTEDESFLNCAAWPGTASQQGGRRSRNSSRYCQKKYNPMLAEGQLPCLADPLCGSWTPNVLCRRRQPSYQGIPGRQSRQDQDQASR